MTRDEVWKLLVKRNPRFETGPVRMRPEEFRRFFDFVWREATKKESPTYDWDEWFRQRFGNVRVEDM